MPKSSQPQENQSGDPDIPKLEGRFNSSMVNIRTHYETLREKAEKSYGDISSITSLIGEKGDEQDITTRLQSLEFINDLLEIDEYLRRYEISGALCEELYHRHLGRDMRERSYTQNKDDCFTLDVLDKDRDFVYVRYAPDIFSPVNTKLGHGSGDQALGQVNSGIEDLCTSAGIDPHKYEMYRPGGVNFCLALRDVPIEQLSTVLSKINSVTSPVFQELESPIKPLIVSTAITRAEVIKMFNEMQRELAAKGHKDELKVFGTDGEGAKYITKLFQDISYFKLEYSGLKSLSYRVFDKVRELQAEGKGLEEIEEFWKMYISFFFPEDSGFSKFDAWVPTDTRKSEEVKVELDAEILSVVQRKVFNGWKEEDVKENALSKLILEAMSLKVTDSRGDIPSKKELQEKVSQLVTENNSVTSSESGSISLVLNKEAKDISLVEFRRKYVTKEKVLLDSIVSGTVKLSTAVENYEKGELDNISEIDKIVNRLTVDFRLKDALHRTDIKLPDGRHGLLEYISDNLALIGDGKVTNPEQVKKLFAQVNSIFYKLKESFVFDRDSMTGLLHKDVLQEKARTMVEDALLDPKKNVAIVSYDANNVKKGNEIGDRSVGDNIINGMACGITRAIQDTIEAFKGEDVEIDYVVSRSGGDEDTVCFIYKKKSESGDDVVMGLDGAEYNPIQYVLRRFDYHISQNTVPGGEHAKSYYQPMEIKVGRGYCNIDLGMKALQRLIDIPEALGDVDRSMLMQAIEDLPKYQSEGEDNKPLDENFYFLRNTLESVMERISDKFVDYNKAYEKFIDVFEMLKILKAHPEIDKDSNTWKFFRDYMKGSAKSLAGNGIEKLEEIYARLNASGEPYNIREKFSRQQFLTEYGIKEFDKTEINDNPEVETIIQTIISEFVKKQVTTSAKSLSPGE